MEPADSQIDLYRALARELRADSIRCSTAAGSGHPTSSLAAADLMAVLLAGRKAYCEALAALGTTRADVVVLDAEVSNSTHAEDFKQTAPERFFEMYIAEQQMVAAAGGMQVVGFVPFASTFAAFFSRAFDFIRMAAVSGATLCLSGSQPGVSIGEDGPSQMALEDLAMMRNA